jgi:hypothetical protein
LEGVYEDGKIEFAEIPVGLKRARVMVTFLPDETAAAVPGDSAKRREGGRQLVEMLQRGVDFGTEPLPTREELYADRIDRF